ncbi:helix-turn-helix domain-containing protein [Acholeplasma hippikon]|uniref:Transcriptional repressor DicA n=1 Tax=Acholeplasma hippikon TaxID=264636 RepID=A0A449BI52_9MOLU|nr:helix-turn-helix transcriptional regulator [Acholeplasma hippikon]VEU82134.1 transcriptional repressor DicA [Acholeplasma hippikon]
MLKINENIRILRKDNNLTQEKLASYLNLSAVSVSKWESGETCPDISLIPELAYIFKVSIDELMGYDYTKKELEILDIMDKYQKIDNHLKYNGECKLINDAYRKYPNDLRIINLYMFDKAGGYADNDPKVLIKHSVELLHLSNKIKEESKDLKLVIDAITLAAKIYLATNQKEKSIELIHGLPSLYHTSNQRLEQLFDKNTKAYMDVLNENLKEVSSLFGDKLIKSIYYDLNLTNTEKKTKIESLLKWLCIESKNYIGVAEIYNQIYNRAMHYKML